MRLRRLGLLGGPLALVVATVVQPIPAYAANEFAITLAPAGAHPTETTTVTGDATSPTCADDGVDVTLHYTKPNGSTGAVTVSTTTDSAGQFTAVLTVPDKAVAGDAADVVALIADCTPPSQPTVSRSSVSVDFAVLAFKGALTTDRTSGKPGQTVRFAGTNCWGGDVEVFFGKIGGIPAKLLADKTFSGGYPLPNVPDGTYRLGATCPGTDYAPRAIRLVNPRVVPPATPVPGQPTFTG
jgi:hypothetical protein